MAREQVSVPAEEWTSTCRRVSGALRLKRKYPNEPSTMSAMPATQTADPTSSNLEDAPEAHGRNVLAATSLA